jgi:hypothetical protein
MTPFTLRLCLAACIALAGSEALARNTFVDLDVAEARSEGHGRENLLDVPAFMLAQTHPAIAKDLGVVEANRSTNAFNKSDRAACQIAFLSALIALQERARLEGGDAVVDIRSVTRGNPLESATQFRCVAGNVVAAVALQGRIVKLKK